MRRVSCLVAITHARDLRFLSFSLGNFGSCSFFGFQGDGRSAKQNKESDKTQKVVAGVDRGDDVYEICEAFMHAYEMERLRKDALEGGLEPPTLWLTATRSNQLSYSSLGGRPRRCAGRGAGIRRFWVFLCWR